MKYYLTFILSFCLYSAHAQYAAFRIFGEITTVENQTYKGFITWGEDHNYWIDFFEATKIGNPYSHYFKASDGVIFYNQHQSFANPPTHVFSCRFGNIRSLRPTGSNEVLLQLRNGSEVRLTKGKSADIGNNVRIMTEKEIIVVKWEYLSEVRFMSADSTHLPLANPPLTGVVKSSQGLYKGLICWNSFNKQSIEKKTAIDDFLQKVYKVIRENSVFKALPKGPLLSIPGSFNVDVLYPTENITINMPNTGCVVVPAEQFEELEMISPEEVNLLTYEDFTLPQPIEGEVTTRKGTKISGTLAYDLDESFDFEVLDGKNNRITYCIPFKYISLIEPKNYKYSFITLRNGSSLSLGDSPDVNRENSGIIIFDPQRIPTYIPWEEIKSIRLK